MSEEVIRDTGSPGGTRARFSARGWIVLILASTAAVLLISVWCLSNGITTVFMHLYYFPIILIAYRYRYRGFVLASLLAAAYVGLVYGFQAGQADVIVQAWYRFFVFVGIAATIAYLAERLARDQEELEERSRTYRNLFTHMLEGFAYCRMISDADGRPADWVYLDVNPAFEQMTGLKDIVGKRVLEAIPDVRTRTPELFDTYGRVASTGIPETFEIDFTPLNMWMKVSVFSPEKGYFVAVFWDITQRRKAEEALRESEKRYRDLFENTRAVMLLIDPKSGSIADANDAAARFYGYSRQELAGLPVAAINIADPAAVRRDMDRAAGSQGEVFQFRHRLKDGRIRDVRVFSAPLVLGGRPLLHSIIMDVTDQQRAEDALVQTNKKLNLLSSITRHDITNQLLALKGYLVLSERAIDDPARIADYLKKEEQAAEAIERQIAFTKEYQDLGVRAPVWESIETCLVRAASSLPLRDVRLDNRCGPLEIYADPLFERVFYNLTDNALRYGGPGMRTITVTEQERGEMLVIVFEDDGNGISPEDRRRLFERGFGHHTGLGLFLSREILAITGITITETGEPGKGARFEIAVPKGAWRRPAEG